MKLKGLAIIYLLIMLVACKQEQNENPNTFFPEIISLTSDKSEISIGEVARITCDATGGDLEYEWDVFLGDIIPASTDGSVVNYSGSECCSGEKRISCTVRNDKGEITHTVDINILEE